MWTGFFEPPVQRNADSICDLQQAASQEEVESNRHLPITATAKPKSLEYGGFILATGADISLDWPEWEQNSEEEMEGSESRAALTQN